MKTSTFFKTLWGITSLAVFSCFNTTAQITLTVSDMIQIGGVYVSANDTLPTISPGSSGANQIWNLSALKNDYTDTDFVVNPATLPYYSDFTASHIGERIDSRGVIDYSFDNLSINSLTNIGSAYVRGTTVFLSNIKASAIEYSLPATYLSYWGANERTVLKENIGSGDSLEFISSTAYSDTVDGYGSLTTPVGTYPNTLRVIELATPIYDSEYTYNGSWKFTSVFKGGPEIEILEWLTNRKGSPLAILNLNTPHSNSVGSGSYLLSSTLGIEELSDNSNSLVYPNPASSNINIEVKSSSQDGYIKIVDLAGREIETTTLRNGKAQFNVSTYTNGMYLYIITDINGNLLDKGKFSVMH
jgi:hypothetical protein